MIEFIYRFMTGFLTVTVSGINIPRFFNLCTRHDILLQNVKYLPDERCCFTVPLKNVYELKPLLKKTGVRILKINRHGVPFWCYRYRARKVFPLILLVVSVGVFLLSTRIWRIEVVGNSSIGEETILKYLENKNIEYGVSRNRIDNDKLELELRQDFDPIIWASVYEKGTKLVVCVQEKIGSEKTQDTKDGCTDLIAAKDAVIKSVITRKGIATVKAGDKVKAGDILISGRQEILDDNGEIKEYFYESADADVMGYTIYDYEDKIPVSVVKKQKTGRTHSCFFLRISMYQYISPKLYADFEHYENLEETHQLCLLDSFYLPVYYGRIKEIELEKKLIQIDKKTAKELALKHFQQFVEDLNENGVLITDKNVMIEKTGQNYHVYGKVKVCERITKPAPTEIIRLPETNSTESVEE